MRAGPLALALLAAPGLLIAQLPDAEAAFRRGDYVTARTAYERVLATDSLNIRALHRLAILDGWDGKLSRSLQRLARARRLAPSDADIIVSQAQVLAWTGRLAAAEALYDSVLARSPDRVDALAGRARTVAWRGDLDRAEQRWRAALERYPDAAELLVGLAQTLYWKGQPVLAETYAARARTVAPGDRAVRDLERVVRAALRPEIATNADGANDSDNNDFVSQEGTVAGSLDDDVRGTLRVGWRRATDRRHRGTSYGGGGSVVAALGKGAVLRAGLGDHRDWRGSMALRRQPPTVCGGRRARSGGAGAAARPVRPNPRLPAIGAGALLRTQSIHRDRGARGVPVAAESLGRAGRRRVGIATGVGHQRPSDGLAHRLRAVTGLGCEQRDRARRLDHQQCGGDDDLGAAERDVPVPHTRPAVPAGALALLVNVQPLGCAHAIPVLSRPGLVAVPRG